MENKKDRIVSTTPEDLLNDMFLNKHTYMKSGDVEYFVCMNMYTIEDGVVKFSGEWFISRESVDKRVKKGVCGKSGVLEMPIRFFTDATMVLNITEEECKAEKDRVIDTDSFVISKVSERDCESLRLKVI